MSGAERIVGRIGGLAIALGVGAAAASVPWLASADAGSLAWDGSSLLGVDPSALLGPAASDPFGLDLEVSYNGQTLLDWGTGASATSAHGGLAIAFGDGSTANAGTFAVGGTTLTGNGDFAFANGADTTAVASGGDYDSAVADSGGSAYSGLWVVNSAAGAGYGDGGSLDSAYASGSGSAADAVGQSHNIATALHGGVANAGLLLTANDQVPGGSSDIASADGAGAQAQAYGGFNDTAFAHDAGSTAVAGGYSPSTSLPYDNDVAAAFQGTNAVATDHSYQTVITPYLDSGLSTTTGSPTDGTISDIYAAVGAIYQNAGDALKEVPNGFPSNDLSGIDAESQFIDGQQNILSQLESDQLTVLTNANPTVLADLDKELFAPANDLYSDTTAYASAVFTGQGAATQFDALLQLIHADFSVVSTDFNVLFGSIVADIPGLSGLADIFTP